MANKLTDAEKLAKLNDENSGDKCFDIQIGFFIV